MAGGRQLAEAATQLRGHQQPGQPERAQPGGVHLHGHRGLGLGAGTRAQPHRVRQEVPPEHLSPHQTLVIIQQWYFIKPSVCVAVWRWTDLLQSSSYLNSYHWPSPPPNQAKGSFLSSFYFDQFQMTKDKIILKRTLIIITTLLSTSMFKLYYYCASFVIFYNFWVLT